jgi:NADPH2:quinone reductase
MRALGERFFGKPDILEILDLPKPEISGPEDILVRVKAIRINPGDGIRAAGYSRVLETVQ